MNKEGRKGFLQMCADRRFHTAVEKKFCELTGLSETDYWVEARAGGAPAIKDPTTADYAYTHGATLMGWASHGSGCGGFPGVDDEKMMEKLEEVIEDRQKRYPKASHFQIFSTEEGTVEKKVK